MTTGLAKYPYPASTAAPDVPADILLLAQRIVLMNGAGIGYVADSTALSATITNADAFTGWSVYHAAADCTVRYNGAAFKLSGTKRFASAAAQTTWNASYSGLLDAGMLSYRVDVGITDRWTGAAWVPWDSDWITWTTAPTNITVGTGGSASSVQRYKWIAGRVYFDYKFVLGTSGQSVGTTPLLNLPITLVMAVPTLPTTTGEGSIYDFSPGAVTYTKTRLASATTARIDSWAAGAYVGITAIAPITFASGDIIAGGFWGDTA